MTMMSRTKAVIIALLIITGGVSAQSAKAQIELRTLLDEFLAGASRNDAAVHDRFWAEDLIYTRSAGVRITKEELMKGVRSEPPPKPEDSVTLYSAEDVQIRVYGTTAVVAFKLVGKTSRRDGASDVSEYLNTGTFVLRNGRWQAVAWQATAIPKRVPHQVQTQRSSAARPANLPERTYTRSPQGGCYYLNSSGKKTYVAKDLCS